jgi:hypothetical protein
LKQNEPIIVIVNKWKKTSVFDTIVARICVVEQVEERRQKKRVPTEGEKQDWD